MRGRRHGSSDSGYLGGLGLKRGPKICTCSPRLRHFVVSIRNDLDT